MKNVTVLSIADFIKAVRFHTDYSIKKEDLKNFRKNCHNLDIVASLLPPGLAVYDDAIYEGGEYIGSLYYIVCAISGKLIGAYIGETDSYKNNTEAR